MSHLVETSNIIATTALLVALGSLGVAFTSARRKNNTEHDAALLENLVLSLKRAYDELDAGDSTSLPRPDRLGWLTASRHILAYQSAKPRLLTPLYQELCADHEEFWRHQFYELFQRIKRHDYFGTRDGDGKLQENIEPTSAAILLAFSDWPESRDDPVDSVDLKKLVQERKMFSARFRLFREYISEVLPGLYEQLQNDS